jgi:hypothetical protein
MADAHPGEMRLNYQSKTGRRVALDQTIADASGLEGGAGRFCAKLRRGDRNQRRLAGARAPGRQRRRSSEPRRMAGAAAGLAPARACSMLLDIQKKR